MPTTPLRTDNMKTYKRGDQVWCAEVGSREEWIECPVCFGKRQVTIILGNNEHVITPCAFCASGYDAPRGVISEYKHEPKATSRVIESVRMESNEHGERYSYLTTDRYYYNDDCIFDTEAEALAYSAIRAQQSEKETFENFLRRKKDGKTARSYSWGVGYHRGEAKRLREQADRHDRACQVCKERSKEDAK